MTSYREIDVLRRVDEEQWTHITRLELRQAYMTGAIAALGGVMSLALTVLGVLAVSGRLG